MKGQLLDKIQSSEQAAGVTVVVLAVLSLFMSLVPILMLALLTHLTWRKSQRFVWTTVAYAALPTVVAFAAHHLGFGIQCLILWVMAVVTCAIVTGLQRVKPLPIWGAVFGLTGLAFLLSVLSVLFFPGIEQQWQASFARAIAASGIKLPIDVVVKLSDSSLFVMVTGEYLALIIGKVLLSIALGLGLTAVVSANKSLLRSLAKFSVPKSYVAIACIYALVLSFYHPAWLLAGFPVVIVPLVMAGLSLCLATGWLRRIWWTIAWMWVLVLLAAVLVNPGMLMVGMFLLVTLLGVIALVGFVDALFDFRARKSKGV